MICIYLLLVVAVLCVGVAAGFAYGCVVGFHACGRLVEDDLRRLRSRVHALVFLRRRRRENIRAWYPDAWTVQAVADRRKQAEAGA